MYFFVHRRVRLLVCLVLLLSSSQTYCFCHHSLKGVQLRKRLDVTTSENIGDTVTKRACMPNNDSDTEFKVEEGKVDRRAALWRISTGLFSSVALFPKRAARATDDPWADLAGLINAKVVLTEQELYDQTRKLNDQIYILEQKRKGKGDKLGKPNYVPSRPLPKQFAEELLAMPTVILEKKFGKNGKNFNAEVTATVDEFKPYFLTKYYGAQIAKGDITNQFYFNFLAYCTWKGVAKFLPTKKERRLFTLALGEEMLAGPLQGIGLKPYDARASAEGLRPALDGLRRVLRALEERGYLEGWELDEDGVVDGSWDIGGGAQFNLVAVREAVMSSKMLLEYEGTRMTPDYLNGAILAYLSKCNTKPTLEQYYIDDTYRPNTDDYTPSQVLISVTLEEEDDY